MEGLSSEVEGMGKVYSRGAEGKGGSSGVREGPGEEDESIGRDYGN